MFEQNVSSPFITGDIQTQTKTSPLRSQAKIAISNYLSQLNGNDVDDMYDLVLSEIEAPMLEEVMMYTRGNQTRAANLLGINRGTLRKKLKKYGIAPPSNTVICPQCDSQKTELISEFGATACKALYKCSDCLEPFEFFKCI